MSLYIKTEIAYQLTSHLIFLTSAINQEIATIPANRENLLEVTKSIIKEKVSFFLTRLDYNGCLESSPFSLTSYGWVQLGLPNQTMSYLHPNGFSYVNADDFIEQHALVMAETFYSFSIQQQPAHQASPTTSVSSSDSRSNGIITEKQFMQLVEQLGEIFTRNIPASNAARAECKMLIENNTILLDYLSGLPIDVITDENLIKQKRISAKGFDKFTRVVLQQNILTELISSTMATIPPQMDLIPFLTGAKDCVSLLKTLITRSKNEGEAYVYKNLIKFAELDKVNLENLKIAVNKCDSFSSLKPHSKQLIKRLKNFVAEAGQTQTVGKIVNQPPVNKATASVTRISAQEAENIKLQFAMLTTREMIRALQGNGDDCTEQQRLCKAILRKDSKLLQYIAGVPLEIIGSTTKLTILPFHFSELTAVLLRREILMTELLRTMQNGHADLVPFLLHAKHHRKGNALLKALLLRTKTFDGDYLADNLKRYINRDPSSVKEIEEAIASIKSTRKKKCAADLLADLLSTPQTTSSPENTPVQGATTTQTAPAAEVTQAPARPSIPTTLLPSFSVFCSTLPKESESVQDEPPTKKRRTVGTEIMDATALITLNHSPVFAAATNSSTNGPLPSVRQLLQGDLRLT